MKGEKRWKRKERQGEKWKKGKARLKRGVVTIKRFEDRR